MSKLMTGPTAGDARLTIRHATADDAAALAAIEAECFPPAEAAGPGAIRARLAAYPDCFWLLCDDSSDDGGAIVSFINGFATDRRDLTDDMYDDPSQHDPHGAWQMIFGVDTVPASQHHGYASLLMRRVIADTRAAGRAGLVLTCKDRLVGFYARFGYVDEGISDSTHGDVVWHQMRLTF
ncbi:GNAT family N-acetyltransferase [Bifidobacterium amazonense]|uniref:GNAT family N-acetyltransferase n=1 Tax=Bifidobacterium amazonense TaxID=2809027 RepID=A0ABS9VRD2_9BIFI|nr:GNAT family N-acetyltransferase [Bifidobacterium amazonense]MCH9274692.1 GNAT family N-acetyltransferase [Bifidobacterium amazonense]